MNNSIKNEFFIIIGFFLSALLVKLLIYTFIVPNLFYNDYSHIGLMSGDSVYYHNLALKFVDELINSSYDIGSVLSYDYLRNSHIILIGLLYLILDHPIIVLIFNSVVFSIIIYYLIKISKLIWNNLNDIYLFTLLSSLFLLFMPTYSFAFYVIGKDTYTFLFTIIIIYYFYIISASQLTFKLNYQVIIKTIFFLIAVFGLLSLRLHFFLILLFSFLIYFCLILIKDKLKDKNLSLTSKNFTILFLFLIFIYLFIYYFISYEPLILQIESILKINEKGDILDKWEFNIFIPDFFEYLLISITSIKNNLIDFNINIQASTILKELDSNVKVYSTNQFINNIPSIIYLSILSPVPSIWFDSSNALFTLLSIEALITYIILLSIFIDFKNIDNFSLLLIVISILGLFSLFYINSNLGTFLRVRAVFIFLLILVGIKHWMLILKYLFHKFNLRILKSDTIFKNKNGLFNLVIINSILLLIFAILLISRDIYLINKLNISNELNLYFLTLIFINFFSTILINPITESYSLLNVSKNFEKNSILNNHIKKNLFFFTLLIFIVILVLIFLNDFIFTIFNINRLDLNLFLYISTIVILIPLNTFLSAFLYNSNKSYLPYLIQLISPIISIYFFYILHNSLNNFIILIVIVSSSLINSLFLLFFSIRQGFDYRMFLSRAFYVISLSNNFKLYFNTIFNIQLIYSLVLLFTYSIVSNISPNNFSIFIFFFKIILFISVFFNSIYSSIFIPLLKHTFNTNLNKFKIFYLFISTISIYLILFFLFIIILFNKLLINFLLNTDSILNDNFSLMFVLLLLTLPSIIFNSLSLKLINLNKSNKYFIIVNYIIAISYFIILTNVEILNIQSVIICLFIYLIILNILQLYYVSYGYYFKLFLISPLIISYTIIFLLYFYINTLILWPLLFSIFLILLFYLKLYNKEIIQK